MFVACEGGPSVSRLEYFPPRLEVPEKGGVYVLADEVLRHLALRVRPLRRLTPTVS